MKKIIFIIALLIISLNIFAADTFDTETRVWQAPLVQVDGETWLTDVVVFLGVDGEYHILDYTEVNCGFSPPHPACFECSFDR